MNPSKEKYYRALFGLSAVYDVMLGTAFTFFGAPIFNALGIAEKLPAFAGYITLPGAFVIVIGIACALIARGDMRRNADLILICALYKFAYAATVIYYWCTAALPHVTFGIFAIADTIFFALMMESFFTVRKARPEVT